MALVAILKDNCPLEAVGGCPWKLIKGRIGSFRILWLLGEAVAKFLYK
jgi:hypothetical protein